MVVHRRCIEPMFSILNQVAYNGRMFCKTGNPSPDKRFMLDRSKWYDIPGKETGNKNHTVPAQIALVVSLMKEATIRLGELPDVYIITPFVSVKRSLDQQIRVLIKSIRPEMDAADISGWLDERCGTIHTFQGKEADEVLLVLGCDRQQGLGAAGWVGQKPNIINVAVSRAKYRLGVVGSLELWRNIPNVKVVCDMLKPDRTGDLLQPKLETILH